jgi:hypothetical protein
MVSHGSSYCPAPDDFADIFSSELAGEAMETVPFSNQMQNHAPIKLDLDRLHEGDTLLPGQSLDVPILLHVSGDSDTRINMLLTYSNVIISLSLPDVRRLTMLPGRSLLLHSSLSRCRGRTYSRCHM